MQFILKHPVLSFSRHISKTLTVIVFFLLSSAMFGQEITVSVTDMVVSKIKKLDVTFSITEPSTLDSDNYANVAKNKRSEKILAELDAAGLKYKVLKSEMDSTHKIHPIKRKSVSEVRKVLHYEIQLHSLSKIHKFSDVKLGATNLLITDFEIIDEEAEHIMQQSIIDLYAEARKEAELIARALNKNVGEIIRIKQVETPSTTVAAKLAMTMPTPKDVIYLNFEITFEAVDK